MKPKYLKVLEALNQGLEVKLPSGHILCLGENETDKDLICFKCTKYTGIKKEKQEPFLLPFDIELNYFMQLCEEFSDDEIAKLCADITLKE